MEDLYLQQDIIASIHNNFVEKFGESYTSLVNNLEELITTRITGAGKFIVVGLEAGFGKSLETIRIISDHINKLGVYSHKFLLVKRFKTDIHDHTKLLNNRSNVGPVALGITSENWNTIQKDLSQLEMYQVVIISHARYIRLSKEPSVRAYFERSRDTLIIDEQIQLPIYSFSRSIWNDVRKGLPESIELTNLHNAICKPLLEQLDNIQCASDHLKKVKLKIDMALLNEYEELLKVNWRYIKGERQANEIRAFINFLKCSNKFECLYDSGRVSTYDRDTFLWTLSNNIILDANAGIDKRYQYAKNTTIDQISLQRIIDHSSTTLHTISFNPSKTRISQVGNQEYYNRICDLIKETYTPSDKLLIIGHNKHENMLINTLRKRAEFYKIGVGKEYAGEGIAVAHFGDIIGQNYWRDFNKVWVIASPNIQMEIYALYWEFFAQTQISHQNFEMFSTKGVTGKFQFREQSFDEIKHGYILSEIYQAVKRVNRDGRRSADIYIVHNDQDIVDDVISQLKNVKIGTTIDPDIKVKQQSTSTKQTKGAQFVQLLNSLSPGEYPKSDIYKMLGWKDNGDLSRYLNKDEEIQRMKRSGRIDWTHRTIII